MEDRDLNVPPEVQRDAKAVEVLRAWVANDGLVCALRPTTWQDRPGAWGIVLADAARHVANALDDLSVGRRSALLTEVQEKFNAELDKPTDDPKGSSVEQPEGVGG